MIVYFLVGWILSAHAKIVSWQWNTTFKASLEETDRAATTLSSPHLCVFVLQLVVELELVDLKGKLHYPRRYISLLCHKMAMQHWASPVSL
jgi:hypothetical protein